MPQLHAALREGLEVGVQLPSIDSNSQYGICHGIEDLVIGGSLSLHGCDSAFQRA